MRSALQVLCVALLAWRCACAERRPVIVACSISVAEGATVALGRGNILAVENGTRPEDITISPLHLEHGRFLFSGGRNATSWTQADVDRGALLFEHDGSESPPGIGLWASDPQQRTSEPAVARINFTRVNDAPELRVPIADQLRCCDATVDAPYDFAFAVGTFVDEEREALAYAATTLPAWMAFNATARRFYGTPRGPSEQEVVVVVATDPHGASATCSFAVRVAAATGAARSPRRSSVVGAVVGSVVAAAVVASAAIAAVAALVVRSRRRRCRDDVELAAQRKYAGRSWSSASPSSPLPAGAQYALAEPAEADRQLVAAAYARCPVPGLRVGRVRVVVSPALDDTFGARLRLLQGRAGQQAFAPRWPLGSDAADVAWRARVARRLREMCAPYADAACPDVSLAPVWHGTDPAALESLLSTGFANLATTDAGFFGKGIYASWEARYAHDVYSRGALLLCWASLFSAYPVVGGDGAKFVVDDPARPGRSLATGNYENYDAHFVPVRPASMAPGEVDYVPCAAPDEQPVFHELVVFESAQVLPRYLVDLVPDADASPGPEPAVQLSRPRRRCALPQPQATSSSGRGGGQAGSGSADDAAKPSP
eukprot:m51a1_g10256 hypothetical protein (601) ;mRNA; r:88077-90181